MKRAWLHLVLLFLASLACAQSNVTSGGTSSGGTSGGNPFGPPNYPGTSRSTAPLGTITSPFNASTPFNTCFFGPLNPTTNKICRFTDQNLVQFGTNGSGTVNTAGTAVTLVSGTNFASNWALSLIVINSVTYSIVSSTTTTMVLATSAGTQSGVAYTFAGINLDDDLSQSNFSSSGGFNDNMCNVGSTACGIKGNSVVWLFGMAKQSNGAFFNATNGGENPNLKFPGPFGFSRVNPNVLYNVNSKNLLTTNTVVTNTTPMTSTPGATFDFATCPGPAALVAPGTPGTSASILSIAFNDAMFSSDISWAEPINGFPGGQGTAHYALVYTPGIGCQDLDVAPTAVFTGAASIVTNVATVTTTGQPNMPPTFTAQVVNASNANFNCGTATITAQTSNTVSYTCSPSLTNTGATTLTTGAMIGFFANIYANCLSSCATAVPVGQNTTCFDANYYLGSPNGIHDSQMSPSGYGMRLAGGCHSLAAGSAAFWQIGSTTNILGIGGGTSSWSPGNEFNFSGHNTDGSAHFLTTNDPCPNVRVENPLSTTGLTNFTLLTCFPGAATASSGAHGGMAYPFGNDSGPWWIATGNTTGFSIPGQMTLSFLEGEFWGDPTSGPLPILRVAPMYNSTTSGGFGCTTSEGFVFQGGDGAMYPADAFANFGNDSRGNPLCSPLVVAMQ